MKKVFIVSNDKFYLNKNSFFNSNKNTYTIIKSISRFCKVYLIARKIKFRQKFHMNLNNISLLGIKKLLNKINEIQNSKVLIISLTPFNFLIFLILKILGAKKENFYLFLRSDGFLEYKIKFGKSGYLIYWFMLTFLKNKLNILSCSRSLTGNFKFKLLFPSEINNKWLTKRKIRRKKITRKTKLLYMGRFRKEKGYLSLINIFKKMDYKSHLTMIGNDQKYLKKKYYPVNANIRILGQVVSENRLIKYYDECDILILPSYIEAYPQVILESLSRLKPIIIFNEIKYLKKTFKFGLFNCCRDEKNLAQTIKEIMKKYQNIQKKILKEQIFTQKNFFSNMEKIFKY
jgi:glycosyltransferase involved in cell wall biosynthesis